jgi:hypothetical protein
MEEHMRRIHLLFVIAAIFILSAPGSAEMPPEASAPVSPNAVENPVESPDAAPVAPSEGADELAWDQLDDPDTDPKAVETEASLDVAPSLVNDVSEVVDESAIELQIEFGDVTGPETSHGVVLGPQGVDDLGRTGRLHTVLSGDTLWDLSSAYLGTPWVWPSVWIDNDAIANPHLIMPGERIWITANEMRVVSDAEGESYLTPVVAVSEVVDEMAVVEEPIQPLAALGTDADDPSTLEAFPVAVPGEEADGTASGRRITVSQRAAMGFVSADDLAGASSIVGSPVERTFLAEGDPIVLGMGEGDVEVGDEFTVFEVVDEIRDIETNRMLGHHVNVLGWIEVKELTGDTSIGEIRVSYSEMERGVRVMPRPNLSHHVTARDTPDAIEGKIVFLPSDATVTADGGYVYLNRGEFHGIEVGSDLEVFDPGAIVNERSRRVDVRTPDHRVAKLIVVSVMPDSSVAFVLSATRELEVGDDVRPHISRLAQR